MNVRPDPDNLLYPILEKKVDDAWVRLDCEQLTPWVFMTAVSSGDPDAKAWLDDLAFRRRKFVFQTHPSKILDGPGSEAFWGEPRIKVGQQDLEFEWRIKAKPLDQTPVIALSVNRFSGNARESYSMLKEPNQGPLLVHWARTGHCEVHKKKL